MADNVKITHIEDTTTNITAGKRASMFFFDTTKDQQGYYKADASTLRMLATLDSTNTPTHSLGSLTIIDGKFVGLGTSKGQLLFDDEATDTITVKYAQLLLEDSEQIANEVIDGEFEALIIRNTDPMDDGDTTQAVSIVGRLQDAGGTTKDVGKIIFGHSGDGEATDTWGQVKIAVADNAETLSYPFTSYLDGSPITLRTRLGGVGTTVSTIKTHIGSEDPYNLVAGTMRDIDYIGVTNGLQIVASADVQTEEIYFGRVGVLESGKAIANIYDVAIDYASSAGVLRITDEGAIVTDAYIDINGHPTLAINGTVGGKGILRVVGGATGDTTEVGIIKFQNDTPVTGYVYEWAAIAGEVSDFSALTGRLKFQVSYDDTGIALTTAATVWSDGTEGHLESNVVNLGSSDGTASPYITGSVSDGAAIFELFTDGDALAMQYHEGSAWFQFSERLNVKKDYDNTDFSGINIYNTNDPTTGEVGQSVSINGYLRMTSDSGANYADELAGQIKIGKLSDFFNASGEADNDGFMSFSVDIDGTLTEMGRFNSNGLQVGDNTWQSNLSGYLQVISTNEANKPSRFLTFSTTGSYFQDLNFYKSHNNTPGTLTETIDGEYFGGLLFGGVNSSSALSAGVRIRAVQVGAAGATYIPSDIYIETSTDSARAEALRVKSTGNLAVTGEIGIKLYSQDAEPTITEDNFCAFWKDTNDSNKIYLVFRRGTGDQVKIQLA